MIAVVLSSSTYMTGFDSFASSPLDFAVAASRTRHAFNEHYAEEAHRNHRWSSSERSERSVETTQGGQLAERVLVGGAANEVSKSIAKDANKPGGTNAPLTITEGNAFEVDGFNYDAGWKLGNDGLGGMDVKGLKVTNNRDSKDSALVEVKAWKGNEVIALADGSTEPIAVGTKVSLTCTSTDKLPKSFTKITINDSF